MRTTWTKACLVGALACGAWSNVGQGSVVYVDHFVTGAGGYTDSDVMNGRGPTVSGFTGNWADGAAPTFRWTATSSGLTPPNYGGGATGGAVIGSTTVATTRGLVRNITDLATITGGGSGSNAVYISGVINFTTIVGDGNNGTVQLLAQGGSASMSMQIQNSGSTASPNYVATGSGGNNTSLSLAPNTNYLFVMKISPNGATWSASGNENFSGWIFNLDSGAAPVSETAPLTSATNVTNVLTSGGIFGSGNVGVGFSIKDATAKFDELRVGSTWADVVPPVPEPASLGLITLAGMMLLPRRKA